MTLTMIAHRAAVLALSSMAMLWSSSASATEPTEALARARRVFAPLWSVNAVALDGCLLTIAMPANLAERCTSFTRHEAAGPGLHTGLGVIVIGGSDERLRGLSLQDGRQLWETASPGAVVSQPTFVGDRFVVGTEDGHVVMAEVATGRPRWDATLDAEVLEPPTVDGDLVFAMSGAETLYALQAETGEVVWSKRHPLPRGITLRGQARPVRVDVDKEGLTQRRVYVGHASGRLTIVDRDTGAGMDELDLSQDDSFGDIDADPLVDLSSMQLFVASHTRGLVALSLPDHSELWRQREPGIVRLARAPGMIIAAGAGKVLGLDDKTGTIRWRFTFKSGAPSRLIVKGGRVHFASDRGAVYVLDAVTGQPRQYAGGGTGIAGDIVVVDDLLLYQGAEGRLVTMSNAWRGQVQPTMANNRRRLLP